MTLSPDMDMITWQPGKPGKRSINVSDIREVRRGQRTQTWRARMDVLEYKEDQCVFQTSVEQLLTVPRHVDYLW